MLAGRSLAGLIAAAVGGAVAALYLTLAWSGAVGVSGEWRRVAAVIVVLIALPVLALLGALQPATRAGRAALIAAAVGFGLLGWLAIFSIGLPLLAASLCACVSVARWWRP